MKARIEAENVVLAEEVQQLKRALADMERLKKARSAKLLFLLEKRAQDAEAELEMEKARRQADEKERDEIRADVRKMMDDYDTQLKEKVTKIQSLEEQLERSRSELKTLANRPPPPPPRSETRPPEPSAEEIALERQRHEEAAARRAAEAAARRAAAEPSQPTEMPSGEVKVEKPKGSGGLKVFGVEFKKKPT